MYPVKNVQLYHYSLPSIALVAITAWKKLKNAKPKPRQVCKFIVVTDKYCTEVFTGMWLDSEPTNMLGDAKGVFVTDKGSFIGDPAVTYWIDKWSTQ